MRTGHTGVWQGKRVLVLLRSGKRFVARFKDRRHNTIEFFDHEPVKINALRTLAIWKGKSNRDD